MGSPIRRVLILSSLSRASLALAGFCAEGFKEFGLKAYSCTFNPGRLSGKVPVFVSEAEYRICEMVLYMRVANFNPDLIIVIKGDLLRSDTVRKLRGRTRAPVVNWWIDDPGLIDISTRLSLDYDVFFTNDPDSVPIHIQNGCPRAEFLTFGCDSSVHRRRMLSGAELKKYGADVSFVGLLTPRRAEFLEAVADLGLKVWSRPILREYDPRTGFVISRPVPRGSLLAASITGREAWGDELAKIYSASKIVLNVHAHGKSDPNMRVFETTGCGAFLLTERRRLLGEFFREGRELACFSGRDELRALVVKYLGRGDERAAVAAAGQRRAYAQHTYAARMKELLGRIAPKGPPAGEK